MPDPIFAAIETHKIAYQLWSKALRVEGRLHHYDPGYAEAEQATNQTSDALKEAGMAFAKIQPTTLDGVLALLSYIDAFNHGAFTHPSGNSAHHVWPRIDGEEESIFTGAPTVLPWPYLVMNNIRRALAKLTA